jgi:hypothetical protein
MPCFIVDYACPFDASLLCRHDMALESMRQVYARFKTSLEFWKVPVAHFDMLLRCNRIMMAQSLVEDLIVGMT